ncbi:MAG TPA: hypothetical protein VL728_12955 [Cyclobacteriaceae bacterium]|jgi:hypothetical protein|nr:hypothetical protein [Cyclobacteriaceae bacterium]
MSNKKNMTALEQNRKWIDDNRPKLLETYRNKYIVVVDGEVMGSFDHYDSAANFGIDNYGLEGGFLIEFLTEEEPVNFVMAADLV